MCGGTPTAPHILHYYMANRGARCNFEEDRRGLKSETECGCAASGQSSGDRGNELGVGERGLQGKQERESAVPKRLSMIISYCFFGYCFSLKPHQSIYRQMHNSDLLTAVEGDD